MKKLKEGSLEIQIEEIDGKYVMRWLGESLDQSPGEFLNPYFEEIMDELKGKDLIIKFEELVYINSSMVAPLMRLINNLNKNQVETTILYNSNSVWQHASFKAIGNIIRTMKYIKIIQSNP